MTTPQLAVEYVAVLSMPLKVILQVKSEIVNGKRHQAQENSTSNSARVVRILFLAYGAGQSVSRLRKYNSVTLCEV